MKSCRVTLEETVQDFILNEKNFSTGSRGFHTQGKMEYNGKKYQVNLMLIEIGSKPKET